MTDTPSLDRLYRLLVEQVEDYAIFALDPEGHVLTWNPGAQRFKGYAPDEIIGRHFSTFYTPEDRATNLPQRLLAEAARTGHAEAQGWRVRKDGTRFWAQVTITALRDDDGRLTAFAKITRDLTAQRAANERARHLAAEEAAHAATQAKNRELEELNRLLQEQAAELEAQTEEAQSLTEELEQSTEELQRTLAEAEEARDEAERANRAKMQFLATMSHELRTPLNAIAGYTDLLRLGIKGPLSTEQTDYIDRIERSSRYLLSLIQDVLSFAKVESGRVEFRIVSVPIQPLLDELEQLMMPQAKTARLSLRCDRCSRDVAALGDAERIRQVLVNLLSNAVKFTPAGGTITLGCDLDGDNVRVAVSDDGRGIPPDKLEEVFAPFVQLQRDTAGSQAGTGLGLSISRDLARAMRGDLLVESRVNEGSVFTLVLPRA